MKYIIPKMGIVQKAEEILWFFPSKMKGILRSNTLLGDTAELTVSVWEHLIFYG